ncbi:hypothetical protein [Phyllobacterium leguminum]|uniref:Uncharacterized protein n=1 Tax=Phyllobacterium leguminum TaxID=314237 RepID=A0A318T8A6_9HYPH|nr:hypothetical protein [Phyllobacterium leguminum]PYE89638.1 hypothetical protein C7477_103146 [Phyllobacterium leguminum]
MSDAQINIATELACIARLNREDALRRLEALIASEPDERAKLTLKAEYHRIASGGQKHDRISK